MENPEDSGKQPMTIRLSAEGRRLLAALAKQEGLSKTGVIERAIRQLARRELEGMRPQEQSGS